MEDWGFLLLPKCPERVQAGAPHCWHGTGVLLPTEPPMVEEVCCWCGEVRRRSEFPGDHGPRWQPIRVGQMAPRTREER